RPGPLERHAAQLELIGGRRLRVVVVDEDREAAADALTERQVAAVIRAVEAAEIEVAAQRTRVPARERGARAEIPELPGRLQLEQLVGRRVAVLVRSRDGDIGVVERADD